MATLDEARAVVSVQEEKLEALYRRSDSLLRLAVADLAAVIATSGILAGLRIPLLWPGVLMIGAGMLTVLAATVLFVSAQTGYPRALVQWIGPDIDRLIERLHDQAWNLASFRESLLHVYAEGARDNSDMHDRFAWRISLGVTAMIIGTALFLAGFSYILGGTII